MTRIRSILNRPRHTAATVGVLVLGGLLPAVLVGGHAGAALAAIVVAFVSSALVYLLTKVREAQKVSAHEMRQLWGLSGLLGVRERSFAPPGGTALGANALNYLAQEIASRRPKSLVELGPGASSVLLARAAEGAEVPVLMFGLEHNHHYYKLCEDMLSYHQVSNYSLLHAPVEQLTLPDGDKVEWYGQQGIRSLPATIDVLVVDGPPNPPGQDNRYPAYPVLRDRLRSGALVVVDDAHRPAERRMIAKWNSDNSMRVIHDAGDFVALEIL